MEQTKYLVLENGAYWKGTGFGAPVEAAVGEVVFTTGMAGYLETITDPSYYGQIVVQTFPMIGNYGVISQDFESGAPRLTAYIVREWCRFPSNYRSEGELDAFFRAHGIPGLCGVDTRQITRVIRENGTLNGMLTTKAPPYSREELEKLRAYRVTGAVEHVSQGKRVRFPARQKRFHVVLWDFGSKQNIVRELNRRGCDVTVAPAHTTAREILELRPDGIMLSNGPGDPAENVTIIGELRRLCEAKLPMFGICLGHQLLALAQGARTEKLKYGHRGANQPVKELETGRVYITSQNHGYAVKADTLPDTARISFVNGNDQTCEGIDYADLPAFSVQFHPEACAGPQDTEFLFDRFIQRMERHKGKR